MLEKGRSKDAWATTLVRAARVVAASLGCTLFAEWEGRCSTRGSQIADDLTHNLVESLNNEELDSYLQGHHIEFPEPILQWMAEPDNDLTLGRRCISWIHKNFHVVHLLYPFNSK